MDDAVAVCPHQLFHEHPGLAEGGPVYPVEEECYFTDFQHHEKKLLLHKASMKAYEDTPRTVTRPNLGIPPVTIPKGDISTVRKRPARQEGDDIR